MKKIWSKRRALYRAMHVFIMSVLVFNMSMFGLTFHVSDSLATIASCEDGETQACTNDNGYPGTETCVAGSWDGTCESDLFCGDHITTYPTEECDNGQANYPEGSMEPVWNLTEGIGDRNYCSDSCQVFHVAGTWCGDGVVQDHDEECDDGNNVDGDGCSATCETEIPECTTDADCATGEQCHDGACEQAEPCLDEDGDGYGVGEACLGTDCNDDNPDSWRVDFYYYDGDHDGYYGDGPNRRDDGQMAICYGATIPDGYTTTSNGVDCDDDNPELTTDCSGGEEETATIKAYKVVCESEVYLPNWGQVSPLPSVIDGNTAADFVANTNAKYGRKVCWLQDDWRFQWGFGDKDGSEGVDKTTGAWVGEANALADSTGMCGAPYCGPNTVTGSNYNNWKTFGPTDASGETEVTINNLEGADHLWVREVLQNGYIPYTYPPDGPRENDVSAELYCENDILNYDNYDRIDDVQDGGVYHCIAFNAPKRVKINAFKVSCESEIYLPNWGQVELVPGEPSKIKFDTAENYVANINELNGRKVCWLEDNWQFQWGYNHTTEASGVHKLPGDHVGEADGSSTAGQCSPQYCGDNTYTGPAHNEWKTMAGVTNENGMISMAMDEDALAGENGIWVREVLKDGYIPYTYPPEGPRDNDVSAELYCENDIVNYDNYDLIQNPVPSGVYNCIAFNAPKRVKINAFKVVCKDETYLPNWGQVELVPGEPSRITFNTASSYVERINNLNEEEVCWLQDNWKFQWGYNHTGEGEGNGDGVHKLIGDLVGEANGVSTAGMCYAQYCGDNTFTGPAHNEWKTMNGVTNANGVVSMDMNEDALDGETGIWVREILQDGYIPYTYPPEGPREDDVSAELYCEDDIVNYDNYDLIKNPIPSGVYNCIAFNAPKQEEECHNSVRGHKYNYYTEGGIAGWEIDLYDSEENLVASTTTDEEGRYSFSDLCDGSYIIKEEMKDGWGQYLPLKRTSQDYFEVTLPTRDERMTRSRHMIREKEYNFVNKPMICGHKYDHGHDNQAIADWEISLAQTTGTDCGDDGERCSSAIRFVASTTTDVNGEYCFDVLETGLYQVSEETREDWLVFGESSYTDEFTGEEPLFIDFYNYQEQTEECGDGACNGDETCGTCVADCGACSFASSGGGGGVALGITDLAVSCHGEDSATVSWRTNYKRDSRVVYGLTSNPTGSAPNYGYTSSTVKDDTATLVHSVVVNNLDTNTYYFKAISGTARSQEKSLDMTTCQSSATDSSGNKNATAPSGGDDDVIVLGEEGAPVLEVSKVASKDTAKPGEEIDFVITVKNTGNLTAFGVSLKDILPDNLKFVEFTGSEKSWDLGDLEPQATKKITVKTTVGQDALAGTYANTTEVSATNYDQVMASASYAVGAVATLAETGFSVKELFILLLALSLVMGASFLLRKKVVA